MNVRNFFFLLCPLPRKNNSLPRKSYARHTVNKKIGKLSLGGAILFCLLSEKRDTQHRPTPNDIRGMLQHDWGGFEQSQLDDTCEMNHESLSLDLYFSAHTNTDARGCCEHGRKNLRERKSCFPSSLKAHNKICSARGELKIPHPVSSGGWDVSQLSCARRAKNYF